MRAAHADAPQKIHQEGQNSRATEHCLLGHPEVVSTGQQTLTLLNPEFHPRKQTLHKVHHKVNFNLFLPETLQPALLQAIRECPLFLSSVKDRNIPILYGQSEDDQATAGGKGTEWLHLGDHVLLCPLCFPCLGNRGIFLEYYFK